jgi:hypothetical protein
MTPQSGRWGCWRLPRRADRSRASRPSLHGVAGGPPRRRCCRKRQVAGQHPEAWRHHDRLEASNQAAPSFLSVTCAGSPVRQRMPAGCSYRIGCDRRGFTPALEPTDATGERLAAWLWQGLLCRPGRRCRRRTGGRPRTSPATCRRLSVIGLTFHRRLPGLRSDSSEPWDLRTPNPLLTSCASRLDHVVRAM